MREVTQRRIMVLPPPWFPKNLDDNWRKCKVNEVSRCHFLALVGGLKCLNTLYGKASSYIQQALLKNSR